MQRASYSASEAARLLRVSIPTLKRMCAAGEIPCFRTPGGHLRIPADGLKNLEGKASGLSTSAPSSVLQNRRERVEELNLEGQELRVSRELEKLRAEQAEDKDRRAAQTRAQEQERLALIEAARFEREKEQCRVTREREQADGERERREWHRSWVCWAARSFPDWLTSEQIGLLEDGVNAALGNCEPGDPADDVARVLKTRIERLVAPWRTEREARAKREQLVQRAVQGLPFGATDTDKVRATAVARSALEQVPLGASDMELGAAVAEAMAPTHQAIGERQERERREQLVASATHALPWGATDAEKAGAAAAVREALASVPLRASQAEVQSAMAGALAPIRQAMEKRTEERRERERLERDRERLENNKASLESLGVLHVGTYLEELYEQDEITYEAYSDSEWQRDLEAAVRKALKDELTGAEDFDQVFKFVRSTIDQEIEPEDEDEEA